MDKAWYGNRRNQVRGKWRVYWKRQLESWVSLGWARHLVQRKLTNSQLSMRNNLAKTSSKGRYGIWTGNIIKPGNIYQWRDLNPTQPHNPWPIVCLAYKICWDKGHRYYGGRQQITGSAWDSYHVGCPTLTLSEEPGPRSCTAKRPRTEPNKTGKKRNDL